MKSCDGDHIWKCTQCKDEQKASYYGFRLLVLGAAFGTVFGAVLACILSSLLEWAAS